MSPTARMSQTLSETIARSIRWIRPRTLAGFVTSLALVTAAVLLPAPPAAGEGTSTRSMAAPEDPAYSAGVKAIKAKDYAGAIPLLEGAVAKDGTNADALNWLAYATRMNGDAAKSIPLYEQALAVDPKHKGAHEYIGEAYLTLGNLPKAKEHLARLDSLCFLPCSEYRDLKKAVTEYESSGGKARPASSR
ncbi:MAG: tetratricopeptide repeat protein [Candidatus Rokuibacteriota bacterium]